MSHWTDERPTEPGKPYLYNDGILKLVILDRLSDDTLFSVDEMTSISNMSGQWSSEPIAMPGIMKGDADGTLQ